jgi:hypothetical protein
MMMIKESTREVEDNDAEYACRSMVNIACTRCTEAINTWYREDMGLLLLLEFVVVVVVESDSCMKKEESAAAEWHRRGAVK